MSELAYDTSECRIILCRHIPWIVSNRGKWVIWNLPNGLLMWHILQVSVVKLASVFGEGPVFVA